MKTKTILAALAVIPIGFAACSKKPETTGDTPSPKPSGGYPLTTCVVSEEDLGSMGEPVVYDHEGTTVKFCCKSCIPKFEADPEKYLAKLK